MTKENLKNKLWRMANDLRGSMDSTEFKNYILGLMFFKFISDKNQKKYEKILRNDDINIKDAFDDKELSKELIKSSMESLGYAIEYKYLFSTIIKLIEEKKYTNEILEEAFKNFEKNLISEFSDDFYGLFNDVRLGMID